MYLKLFYCLILSLFLRCVKSHWNSLINWWFWKLVENPLGFPVKGIYAYFLASYPLIGTPT